MFDVAISHAGENADQAALLTKALKARGLAVFLAADETPHLTGANLYTELSRIYLDEAEYCVVLISAVYVKKHWTGREREIVQARAHRDGDRCLIPVRLDSTPLPGLLPTVAYLGWPPGTAETVAATIWEKFYMNPRTTALLVQTAWSGIRDVMLDRRLDDKARRYYLLMNMCGGMDKRREEVEAERWRIKAEQAKLLREPPGEERSQKFREMQDRADFLERRAAQIQAEGQAILSQLQYESREGA
jgi:hypothetical protein